MPKPVLKKDSVSKPKAKATVKPKATAKPKATTKAKATVKPKATAKPKAKAKAKPKAKPKIAPQKQIEKSVINIEEEFPHDMFPWKLVFKDGNEKRTCYFQCEEHRKKHINRYNLNKKNILFMGYKFQ